MRAPEAEPEPEPEPPSKIHRSGDTMQPFLTTARREDATAEVPPSERAAVRAQIKALAKDVATAKTLEMMRHAARPVAVEGPRQTLFTEFMRGASETVRRVGTDRHLSTEDLMEAALAPKPDSARRTCERCVYVGECTADLCARSPDRVVRICSPDAATNPTGCMATLCFDGEQLERFLDAERPADDGSVENPVFRLGIPPSMRVSELQPRLDAVTVEALRWQLRIWHTMRPLVTSAFLDPTEQGLMRGILVPVLMRHLTVFNAGEYGRVSRWSNRYTPEVVKRLLAKPANLLLYLFDHPVVAWVLLWATKILKFVVCLLVFGFPEQDRERIIEQIKRAVSPLTHLPLVQSVVDTITTILRCYMDGVLSAGCIKDTVRAVWGGTIGAFGNMLGTAVSQTTSMVVGLFSPNGQRSVRSSVAWITEITIAPWQWMQWREIRTAHEWVTDLHHDMQTLYVCSTGRLCLGLVLFATRTMGVELFRKAVEDAIPVVGTAAKRFLASFNPIAERILGRKKGATMYDVVTALMQDMMTREVLAQLYDIMRMAADLIVCLARFVRAKLGGGGGHQEACCGESLVEWFRSIGESTLKRGAGAPAAR
jgi:hypothetical protein